MVAQPVTNTALPAQLVKSVKKTNNRPDSTPAKVTWLPASLASFVANASGSNGPTGVTRATLDPRNQG